MNTFIDFITFKDPNVFYVVIGMFFITSSSALIGTYALLRKRALIGDAIAHSLLPGLCLGFIFAGEKDLTFLFLGAFITGWISTFLVDYIVNNSKVKQDAAIGIVLSAFFGFGVVLLTYIQKNYTGEQAGLNHFLFGQAAAINKDELSLFGIIFLIVLFAIIVFYRQFKSICFNAEFAKSVGLPVRFLEFLITSLTVLAIASGIQALGVILMSALIITPAAAARFWTDKLSKMLLISVLFSMVAGILGAYFSYRYSGMPTGPWVVIILSMMTVLSIFLSPKRGVLQRFMQMRKNRIKIHHENILKAIYLFHEKNKKEEDLSLLLHVSDLLQIRLFDTHQLRKGIKKLVRQGFVEERDEKITLSDSGKKESRRIVRLHRLWEQYLLKRTTIDTDHVHSGAEIIEHIITPEIEIELEKELGIEGIPKEDY